MNTTSKLIKLYSKYIEQLQFNRLRFLTRSTASLIIVGNEKKAFNRKNYYKNKNEEDYNSCSSVVGYLEILSQI